MKGLQQNTTEKSIVGCLGYGWQLGYLQIRGIVV